MKRAGWHPQDIIAEVRKRGSSLQALTRQHGFGRTTLYSSLTRRFPFAHAVIADFLGVTRRELWPQWYDEQDRPRGRSRQDRSWRKRAAAERQEAA